MSDDRFLFNGESLPYFDDEYNTTLLNERSVEIPIVMSWLAKTHSGDGLEVGNVLSHYFPDLLEDRRIVDRYEESGEAENIDVFDIKGSFDYIFAISTLEHVRWDPPEVRAICGATQALRHLYGLLKPNGKMLVTVPFGSNPGLDYAILTGDIPTPVRQTVMMRADGLMHQTSGTMRWERKGGCWHQAADVWWERYGLSTPWAETVWFGEFER